MSKITLGIGKIRLLTTRDIDYLRYSGTMPALFTVLASLATSEGSTLLSVFLWIAAILSLGYLWGKAYQMKAEKESNADIVMTGEVSTSRASS